MAQAQRGQAQRAQQGAVGADGAAVQGNDPNAEQDPLGMLLRQLRQASEARRGLPPTLMDRLPSYTYRDTGNSPSKQDAPVQTNNTTTNNDDDTNDANDTSTTDAERTCRSLVICVWAVYDNMK